MPSFSLAAYPWDLVGKDLGSTLDLLRGEIGITGLSIWVASPPVTELRGRKLYPRLYRTGGGLHFCPDDAPFDALPFRPIVSDWVDAGGRLDLLTRTCAQHGMSIRARVSAAGLGQVAQRYPDLASRSAFEVDSRMSICLANPNAQMYLSAVLESLAKQSPFDTVILADLAVAWGEAFASDLATAAPLGRPERSLLAMCFCESCRREACDLGVDADGARQRVGHIIDLAVCEGQGAPESLQGLLEDQPILVEYRRFQNDRLNAVLKDLTARYPGKLLLDRNLEEGGGNELDGVDSGVPAAVITRIDHPDQLEPALLSRARRNELQLPAKLSIGQRGPELLTTMSKATTMEFCGIEIDHFGLLADSALTSIRQAIRYARRAANDG